MNDLPPLAPNKSSGDSPGAAPAGSSPAVLVVDDEPGIVDSLQKVFEREELRVLTARGGSDALEIMRREPVSVLADRPDDAGMSGMDLLKASRSVSPETETILMTAYGTVENAVEAMKQGAYDFVTKPIKRAHVVRAVRKALEKRTLVQENRSLRAQLAAQRKKRADRAVADLAAHHGDRHAGGPVDGDGAVAGRIGHRQGAAGARHSRLVAAGARALRAGQLRGLARDPSWKPSCSVTRRGAFTGAVQRHDGRFLQADKGTLFLDEIGEIPIHMQVKLLRVLQEGEVERLGGRTQRVDLRLVAATNQDLRTAVQEGRFREDLYYRLNVIALRVPPLRDRRDDIPLLAEHFLRLYGERNGRHFSGFARAALDALGRYDWPGNVRELENAVERAVVLSRGPVIEVEDLPTEVRSGGAGDTDGKNVTFAVGTPLGEIERRVIHATLAHIGGDKRVCAQLLGIATRTIYRRLEEERGPDDSAETDEAGALASEPADQDEGDLREG